MVAHGGPLGTRCGGRGFLLPLLLAFPGAVHAHLVNSGLGPFYDGAVHLLLSPGDLLGLTAAALLAGLVGRKAGRWSVIVLPVAWFGAGLVGLALGAGIVPPWLTLLSIVVLGALVAADPKLAPAGVALLAFLYGVVQGMHNGAALAALGVGPVSLLGIVATAFLVALLLSASIVSIRTEWSRIAVRVAGSWVAAVGVLMLGWTLKGAA